MNGLQSAPSYMIRLVFAPQRIQTRSAEGGRSGGTPRSGIQPRQGRPVKKRDSQANGGTVRLILSLIREGNAARTPAEAERPEILHCLSSPSENEFEEFQLGREGSQAFPS